MALPTTPVWSLANFDETTIGGLLSLGPSDLTPTPALSPYFTTSSDGLTVTAESSNGVAAMLDFTTAMPPRYTLDLAMRVPELPHNTGDLSDHSAGFTIADGAGRGVSIYFAQTGLAVSRVDDFGSVTTLPDTTDLMQEITTSFVTIRVAVDSALGRAYVMVGDGITDNPIPTFILPVEQTPPTVSDRFRLFVHGWPDEPVRIEFQRIRLAGDVVIPNSPPVASAGPDRVAPLGQAIRFDGRGSFDVEGAALTYQWRLTDAPLGSDYAAEVGSGGSTDDGDADGYTDILTFASGALPAWAAAGDVIRAGGIYHVIATVDNAGGTLTVETDTIPDSLSASPFRIFRQSLIVGSTTETPYIVPDVQGIYRLELIVNDGEVDSEAVEVLASVVGPRAPFGTEPDVSPIWNALGDEWRLIENRGVFEEAWRSAAQILGSRLLEAWQHHYNYSIRDAQGVFQVRWRAFQSLIAETGPEVVDILPRFGALASDYQFELSTPTVTGLTLVFSYLTGDSPTDADATTVTLTGGSLSTIVSDVNTALTGTGISAYAFPVLTDGANLRYNGSDGTTTDDGDSDQFTNKLSFTAASLPSWVAAGQILVVEGERYTIDTVNNGGGYLTITEDALPDSFSDPVEFRIYRNVRLGFKAPARAFWIDSTSTAASVLGVATDTYNYLAGETGSMATSRSYVVDMGLDLSEFGIIREDLLVLNNGQSFKVDRLGTHPWDPIPNQRIYLFEDLPPDATPEWSVPSVVRSSLVDYEAEGSYPNDLVKIEVYDTQAGTYSDQLGYIDAQRDTQLAVRLDGLFGALMDTDRYELRLEGVKRRKALSIPSDVLSIPRLQDKIPVDASPTIWKENVDFVIEPFYRETDGSAIPMLQWRDAAFVDPDEEPPDIFWAEVVILDNTYNVENLFGRLVGFLRDDASAFTNDFNYVAGVAGLLYAQQRGPNVEAIRTGARILFGQPFAEVDGIITELRDDYSPTMGRMLVQDDDGNDPSRSEIVRTYYWTKDPLDTSSTSGLGTNADTDAPWAEGDSIPQFSGIGTGVDVVDLYNDPTWFVPYVRGGLINEMQKFHYFLVRFNLDLVSLANLSLLSQFVLRVKPTYTHPILAGFSAHEDEIDITDELVGTIDFNTYDSVSPDGLAFMYDDYRGDGTVWSSYDDGATYYDGIIDTLLDLIELCITVEQVDSAAAITGSVDLSGATYPGDFSGRSLVLNIDGTDYTTTFSGSVANAGDVVSEINTVLGANGTAGLDADNELTVTSATTGVSSYVEVQSTTTAALFGVFGFTLGGDFNASLYGTQNLTASTYPTDFESRTLQLIIDGGAPVDVTFSVGIVDSAAVVSEINTTVGSTVAALDSGGRLALWSNTIGAGSSMEIGAGTTAALLTVIGVTSGQTAEGDTWTDRAWGNAIDNLGPWFVDTEVTDVGGVFTGTVGATFIPTYDMSLPAGDYTVCVMIKSGGVVAP